MNGPYLIESAPHYQRYLAAKAAREVVERVAAPFSAFVSGYRDELDRMLAAPAEYLGTVK